MKKDEELNAIKQENATINNKLNELTDEEKEKVSCGASIVVKHENYIKIEEENKESSLLKYRPNLDEWGQRNTPDSE